MGDIETVQAMLTYGAAKTQQAFATAVAPLMAMPSVNRDELATAVYAQLIWQSFCETPLWALTLAVGTCARREVFRPLPVTLERYMPMAFKRAQARMFELRHALTLHQARAAESARQATDMAAARDARINDLGPTERATYDRLVGAGDWRGAALILARPAGTRSSEPRSLDPRSLDPRSSDPRSPDKNKHTNLSI